MEDVKLNENQNYYYNEPINECHNNNSENNEFNINLENSTSEQFTQSKTTKSSSSSTSSINSDTFSNSGGDSQSALPNFSHYAYPYPWALPPPHNNQNCAPIWPYAYPVPYAISTDQIDKSTKVNLPQYGYYYPYYPPPYPIPPHTSQEFETSKTNDPKVFYPYPPPPAPYISYPYPIPPSYTISPSSSRASSCLPDIIITPSTEDVPSKIIFEHKINVQKEKISKSNIEIEEIACRTDKPSCLDTKVIDINLNKIILNEGKPNLNEGIVVIEDIGSDSDSEISSENSEITPMAENCKKNSNGKLQTIKSVSNVQVYNKKPDDDEEEDSDVTTIDGDSDVFESESEEEEDEDLSVIYEESDVEQIGHHDFKHRKPNLNNCFKQKSNRNRSLSLNTTSIYDLTKIDDDEKNSVENNIVKSVGQNDSLSRLKKDLPIKASTIPREENFNRNNTDQNNAEEYDMIAALRATKLQTQKILEDSASFWGKSVQISPTVSQSAVNNKNLESKKNTIEEAKNNFWSTVAATEESEKNQCETQKIDTDFWAMIENSNDDNQWIIKKKNVQCSQLVKETLEFVKYFNVPCTMTVKELPQSQKGFSTYSVGNVDVGNFDIVDIDRNVNSDDDDVESEEDSDSDETDDDVESEEEEEEISEEESESEEDQIVIKDEPAIENLANADYSEEPEIDFWAEIEKSREKTPVRNLNQYSVDPKAENTIAESNFVQKSINDPPQYPEEPREVDTEEESNFVKTGAFDPPQYSKEPREVDTEEESNFVKTGVFDPPQYSEEPREVDTEEESNFVKTGVFDPSKYPEEPREVDTDEEIDFWAEIEGSRRESEDHINFHKAAMFWSKKEDDDDIQNPVQPKPIFENQLIEKRFDSCDLEFYKGEEPIFLNEEEEQLIKKETEQDNDEENNQDKNAPDKNICDEVEEKEDVEIKRSNYRNAMAFFSNPIDENKEYNANDRKEYSPKIEKPNTISNRIENTKSLNKKTEIEHKKLKNGLPDLEVKKYYEEKKISVRARISAFESVSIDKDEKYLGTNLSTENYSPTVNLSRNSSQRSESEVEEEDSGVTDMNRQLSETDTESESFPELRKMSSYQRASTHSRLFKLLQEDDVLDNQQIPDEYQSRPSRRKILHNVSITRRQNPTILTEAETMVQRRERLSLPLQNNKSIDADNPSTPNSPASPILGNSAGNSVVSDKLVKELVQSLLLRSDSSHFKDLPMAKLQAAAKRALEEELDSLHNTSVETTPALTPINIKQSEQNYDEYFDSWSNATAGNGILPSKAFRVLQEKPSGRKSPWSVRCPRVLSSKTVNSDLARVTESPEIVSRNNNSPLCFARESSINKWRKP